MDGHPAGYAGRVEQLRADCANCVGLCCVVPAFSASADFAIDKPAGAPCPHLREDFACGIHATLRDRGFPGCTVFDCFGAGQQVTQVTFGGRDWRHEPDIAGQMFGVFAVMRQLHELLWYLTQAVDLAGDSSLRTDLRRSLARARGLTGAGPAELLAADVPLFRDSVNTLLNRTSEEVRAGGADHRGSDLAGANLAGADLARACLRGALLIGADLRGADLALADVTGADLRGADLSGADLGRTIFLTQPQLDSARGDAGTRLPRGFRRPGHCGGS